MILVTFTTETFPQSIYINTTIVYLMKAKQIKVKESIGDRLKELEKEFGTKTYNGTIEVLLLKMEHIHILDLVMLQRKEILELRLEIGMLKKNYNLVTKDTNKEIDI